MPEFLNGISGLLGGLGGGTSGTAGASAIRVVASTQGVRQNIRGMVTGVNAELGHLGEGVNRGLEEVGHSADVAATRVNHLARIAKIGLYTLATAVPIIGLASIKAAIDYETAFIGVRKTVDATEQQFAMLSRQFRQMAKETPGTAAEFAKLGEAAGALGIAVDDIKDFVDVTSTIGDTTNVSADIAATSLGQLSNVLKLTRADYQRFGSVLVDLGNKGASTEAQILEIAARSGAAGALIGMSAKDVLAFASSVASLGIEVEAGGTALQTFYLQINKLVGSGDALDDLSRKTGIAENALIDMASATTGKGKESFETLAKSMGKTGKELRALVLGAKGLKVIAETAGMSARAFKAFYEEDPTGALQRFISGLGKQDQYERQRTLRDIGMTDSRRIKMLLALSDNTSLLSNNIRWANDAWRDNTALMAEAEKRYASTSSQLTIMRNNFTDIAIEIGTGLLPMVVSAAKWLGEAIPAAARTLGGIWDRVLREPLQRLGDSLAGLGEAAAGVFAFADTGDGRGDGLVRVFEALARSTGMLAGHLSVVVDVLAAIGRSPVGSALGKLALTIGAVALALKVAKSIAGTAGNIVGGTISSFTGLNPLQRATADRQRAQDIGTARTLASAIEAAGLKAGQSIATALLTVSGTIIQNFQASSTSLSIDMQTTATATAKTIQSGFVGLKGVINTPVAGLKSAAQMLQQAAVQMTRAAVVWKADVLAAIRQAGGVFFLRKNNGQFLPEMESWRRLEAQGLTNPVTAGPAGWHVWGQNGPVAASAPAAAAPAAARYVRPAPVQGPPQIVTLPDGTFRSIPPKAAPVRRAGVAAATAVTATLATAVASGVDEAVRRPVPEVMRAAEAAGDTIITNAAEAVGESAEKTAKQGRGARFKNLLASAGSKLMTGFMALLVVDLVASIAAEPVGAMVAGAGFKRAGQAIKEDFFGGLTALFQSVLLGSDEWVGRQGSMRIGTLDVDTKKLAVLGVDSAHLDALETEVGGVKNLDAQVGAVVGQVDKMNQLLAGAWTTLEDGRRIWHGDEQFIRNSANTLFGPDALLDIDKQLSSVPEGKDFYAWRGEVYEALARRVIEAWGKEGTTAGANFGQALVTAVNQAGWSLSLFEISRLPPDVQRRLTELVDGDVTTVRQLLIDELLRNAGLNQDLKTKAEFRAEAKGDEKEAARLALEANVESLELAEQHNALLREQKAAVEAGTGTAARQWVEKYGPGIEAMAASGSPDQSLLERLGYAPKGGSEADYQRGMESLLSDWPQMLAGAGMTGAKPLHDAIVESIRQGFEDGLSLDEMRQELGPLWGELFSDPRGADFLSNSLLGLFDEGIKKAKGVDAKKRQLALWNAFMPDEYDISDVGTVRQQFDRMVAIWMEQFRTAIENADTGSEQNSLLKTINGMLPKGVSQFGSWKELTGALRPGGKPEPGGRPGVTPVTAGGASADILAGLPAWVDPKELYRANLAKLREQLLGVKASQRNAFFVQAAAVNAGVAYEDVSDLVTGNLPPSLSPEARANLPSDSEVGDYIPKTERDETGPSLWPRPEDSWPGTGEAWRGAGENIPASIAEGMAANLVPVIGAANDIAQAIADFFPHSPVARGPLMGLPVSGMQVVAQVAEGIRAAIWMLPVAFEQGLRVPNLSQWTGGILAQIRAAIVAANVLMQTGFAGVTSGGVGGVGGTGGAAGASIGMLGGREGTEGGYRAMAAPIMPPMPGIPQVSQPARFVAPQAAMSSGGGGTNMPIYIDRMTVMGPEDESSIVRRLSFLSPTGR